MKAVVTAAKVQGTTVYIKRTEAHLFFSLKVLLFINITLV